MSRNEAITSDVRMTAGGRDRAPAERPGGNVAALTAIGVIGAVLAFAIGVRGDFPLSDDWSYAYATQSLCVDGVTRFLPWSAASLVFQTWYGAVLCRVFGFSFEALRLSTLVLSVTGAAGFYLLLGAARVRGVPRVLGTLLLALDPLYFNLSFSYMTDVPFVVLAVWAAYAYVRGLDERRLGWLLLGSLFASAALLVRQHGIFVALAAALAALVAGRPRPWRERVGAVLASAGLPALTFALFLAWLFAWHGAPAGLDNKLSEARAGTLAGLVNCAFRGLAYLGLLVAPLAWAARREVRVRHPVVLASAALVMVGLAAALWVREGAAMFYLTNVMYDFGLGPLSLRDTLFLALPAPVALGRLLSIPLTVVALGGGAILATTWAGGWSRWREPVPVFFTFATGLLFLGTLLHARFYFDRYLIAVLPFAIAAMLVSGAVRPRAASMVLTALLAWYGIAGTHDYLAWNRERYAGLATLVASGVPVTAIDGGMEFNGWHLGTKLNRWPSNEEARPGQPATRKSWWWVVDDRFIASFRPLDGYVVRDRRPYRRWLVPGMGEVLILERL